MTGKDVHSYAQDLIAPSETQQAKPGNPRPAPSPKLPGPLRVPAKPPCR